MAIPTAAHPADATLDRAELGRFERMAAEWWDPHGKFKALHRMNPVRIGYIRDHVCGRLGRDPLAHKPLAGLTLADIGCGGGLLSEPMARLGATVTGIDAGADTIQIARVHAGHMGLPINYHRQTAEALTASGARFDVVTAMEIVEHVADVPAFLQALATLLRPGGVLVMSTLNRTPQSFALAIVGAEYVLRWVPRGTHTWRKFLRPSELAAGLRRQGILVRDVAGMVYRPLGDTWHLSARDLDVNYLLAGEKPEG
jgi:2-polyprenyl-6-hydroxyphenyl methylase/3-demethylubiquinone-9 3-methyltransferase